MTLSLPAHALIGTPARLLASKLANRRAGVQGKAADGRHQL
jgi:hypothetical protein